MINNDTIRMDLYYDESYYQNEPEPEVILEFDNNKLGNITINLKRNETLSKQRNII